MRFRASDDRREVRRRAAVDSRPPQILDGIPGFLAWLALVLVVVGAVREPEWVLTVVALLALYTAVRFVLAGVANLIAMRHIARWEKTDWHAEHARRRTPQSLAWDAVHHVVIIPNYREKVAKMRATLERLAGFADAREMVTVVLAMEAEERGARDRFDVLAAEFAGRFARMVYSAHPSGLPGERPGKASNETWAARQVRRLLVDKLGYPVDNLVLTVLDADSVLHERYLEALTCLFAIDEERWFSFWQSPVRYHNNVWEVPPPLSLLHVYSSAWETAYLAAPWWRPLTYSTYSLSLRLAEAVGYWDDEPEDSHIFIKSYFQRDGQVHLRRLYLPFSCDATTGETWLGAFRARYEQTARHAWLGAREIGYALDQLIRRAGVPWVSGTRLLIRVAHDHIMAGAGWLVMTVGAQLPFLFHPKLLVFDSPQIISLTVAMFIITIMGVAFWVLDWSTRPARTSPWTLRESAELLVSVPLLPLMMVVCLVVPVLDAQTRRLLGRPLPYRSTSKV